MSRHKILFRILRIGVRLARPWLKKMKALYEAYLRSMPDWSYHAWMMTNKDACYVEHQLKSQPLISVVVPVFNTPEVHLREMVYSVVNQHYGNWELILADASTEPDARQRVKDCELIDTRIRVVPIENEGIAANTNQALAAAKGEYIAFLDHDDLLHPCALHSVVEHLQMKNPPGIIYTDEDKITDSGDRFFGPFCKPGWSPDLLRNANYFNHLTVIKKELIDQVRGLRPACDGAQDFDLLLRVIDKTKPRIRHVPHILYHWRAAKTSTASNIQTKSYVFKAGEKALRDHLKRNNVAAKAQHIPGRPGWYEVIYSPTEFSVIVGRVATSKEQACVRWLKQMVEQQNLGDDVEIIVGSWFEKFRTDLGQVQVKFINEKTDDYWRDAVDVATKPVCICFKMAALPKQKDGLRKLAAVAASEEFEAVSPVILGDKGTILDSGIVVPLSFPKKLFEGYKYGSYTYLGNTDWVRDVDDLTNNIIALRTGRLKGMIKNSIVPFRRAETIKGLLPGSSSDGARLAVWAHTTFEYRGMLKPLVGGSYSNSQLFRFTPVVTMHIDNFGDSHAREDS